MFRSSPENKRTNGWMEGRNEGRERGRKEREKGMEEEGKTRGEGRAGEEPTHLPTPPHTLLCSLSGKALEITAPWSGLQASPSPCGSRQLCWSRPPESLGCQPQAPWTVLPRPHPPWTAHTLLEAGGSPVLGRPSLLCWLSLSVYLHRISDDLTRPSSELWTRLPPC